MDTAVVAKNDKPPSQEESFPIRAFGYGTTSYWAFLEALLDGLMEYESKKGEYVYATSPVPTA